MTSRRTSNRHRRTVAVSCLLALVLACSAATAQPKGQSKTAKTLMRKAILSPKPFPTTFRNDQQFLATMRRMNSKVITARGKRPWSLYFLAFFPVALQTLSCDIHFFDQTLRKKDGRSHHVASFTQFLSERGQRTLSANLRLDAPPFQEDHEYRMIIARRKDRGLLAEARFTLRRKLR